MKSDIFFFPRNDNVTTKKYLVWVYCCKSERLVSHHHYFVQCRAQSSAPSQSASHRKKMSNNRDALPQRSTSFQWEATGQIETILRKVSSNFASFEFGEENNAWVKWVSVPVLCYYEPVKTIKAMRVQLLIPKAEVDDCSAAFPSQGK